MNVERQQQWEFYLFLPCTYLTKKVCLMIFIVALKIGNLPEIYHFIFKRQV